MLYIIARHNNLRLAWGGKVAQAQPVLWERWQPYARRRAVVAAV
ncbi:hypothetical protein [Rhizobium halophytocola]|uniref:Uncharacterized protein n=1 Tax=Rhizobium halophytocola TaxID=735519 RepID=A0ABS4DZW3_9HYPH|nr:hypothetical protein [Rhizobium halophytocola]MBP1851228.1 hypothetical protein [Rhizobium halophytocola]